MSDKKFLIEGFVPAVVTPFNEAGDMMADQLARIVEWHLGEGADAICIAGDNGEAWTLTPDDRKQLAETTVKTVAGRVRGSSGGRLAMGGGKEPCWQVRYELAALA